MQQTKVVNGQVDSSPRSLDDVDRMAVWVIHKAGFTSAVVLNKKNPDHVLVRLEQGQVEVEVKETDIEKVRYKVISFEDQSLKSKI